MPILILLFLAGVLLAMFPSLALIGLLGAVLLKVAFDVADMLGELRRDLRRST